MKPMTGKRMAELRKKAGLSQAELAEYMGLGQQVISKKELGKRPISIAEAVFLEQLGKKTG